MMNNILVLYNRISKNVNRIKKYAKKKYPSIRRKILGMKTSDGLLYKAIMYFLLIVVGFVFIYPILYMLSISFMSNIDLVDSSIRWIPSKINISNYRLTFKALDLNWYVFPRFITMFKTGDFFKIEYWLPNSLYVTAFIAGISTISVATASALIGYGLARFDFFGKKIIIALIIFTFIMPKTLFFIPTYMIFTSFDSSLRSFFSALDLPVLLKTKGTLIPILAPALSGQGLQSAFFILIFYQFFVMIPKSLEEAAIIDGASSFKIFLKIAIPSAIPAFVITFVYCFALYWNETFFLNIYTEGKFKTIPALLNNLQNEYGGAVNPTMGDWSKNPDLSFTEAKRFAGTLIAITPLIFLYAIVQRWFVESIDKSGITGE